MGFGKKLEEKMLAKGMKQADLVRATGISKTTLSSMIGRDNTKVDVEIFIKICDVLGCDPMDFAEDIPTKSITSNELLTSNEKKMLEFFRDINEEGQKKALERLSEMTQLEQYRKHTKAIYRAADSKDHTEHEIIEDGAGIIEKLNKIPPVTNKEDF